VRRSAWSSAAATCSGAPRWQAAGLDRVTGDQMGMLATVMNGLALRDLLRQVGVPALVYSAIELPGVAERFHRDTAVAALDRGEVAVFVAGTGNPFFTTDTAACLRGIEIRADAVLKATKVDGIYNADPLLDRSAAVRRADLRRGFAARSASDGPHRHLSVPRSRHAAGGVRYGGSGCVDPSAER
jgi:uridylate kinase